MVKPSLSALLFLGIPCAFVLSAANASAKERVLISTVRGFYNTAMDELAEQYMEIHPDVDVEINIQPDKYTITRYYTAAMAVPRQASAPPQP